jgi:adenosylmethionine-8-amino-7-oxononanoate aminotransferase
MLQPATQTQRSDAQCASAEPTRAELEHWDREIVWHAFTQMAAYEPLILARGEGTRVWDIDGNEYLDGVSSVWCNVHGHRHPKLDAAIRAQLDQVAHVTSLGSSNPTTIRLAKRLVDLAPAGLNRVFFSDNGATAVEVALKMALQYWRQRENPKPNKTTYLAFGNAYHGDTLGSVSVGGVERFHAMFQPLLFPVLRAMAPDTYRLPGGVSAEQAREYYLAQVEEILAREHERIVAIVVEPLIQAAAGMVMHPVGFLHGLSELARRYDVLLVADEVAVGFGRTGTMFACEHEGVSPDFLCLAKGLTGGYMPMAATLTTSEVWRAFLGGYEESKTFYHGHTYGGNPLGAAVALATLDVFEEEQTLAELAPKIARMRVHLDRIGEHPHVGDTRQRGLIGAVELVRDRATQEPYPWGEKRGMAACDAARRHGVLLRPLGNVLVAMPPLSVSLAELDHIMLALEAGVIEATEQPRAHSEHE